MEIKNFSNYLIYSDGRLYNKKKKIFHKPNRNNYTIINDQKKRIGVATRFLLEDYYPDLYPKTHNRKGEGKKKEIYIPKPKKPRKEIVIKPKKIKLVKPQKPVLQYVKYFKPITKVYIVENIKEVKVEHEVRMKKWF